MARFENDFDPQQLDREALLEQLGDQVGRRRGGVPIPKLPKIPALTTPQDAPTSGTMPVDGPDVIAPVPTITPPLAPAVREPTSDAPPARVAPRGEVYTGFTPTHDFSAFDTQREQNPQTSAKDAFAMLANQAPPPPFEDKAALAAWFRQYIQPGMDALGHIVSSVDGDTFSYGNHEGNFTVDYAQNAGAAPGSMLQRVQWGAEPTDAATGPRDAPGGSGTFTPLAPAVRGPIEPSTDPMQAILAEIEALQNGGQSPMDAAALMALLSGQEGA